MATQEVYSTSTIFQPGPIHRQSASTNSLVQTIKEVEDSDQQEANDVFARLVNSKRRANSEHGNMGLLTSDHINMSASAQTSLFLQPGQLSLSESQLQTWQSMASNLGVDATSVDVNALVQQVLREAYLENTKDLHQYATKVKYFNAVKKSIREEISKAREVMAEQAGRNDTDPLIKMIDEEQSMVITYPLLEYSGTFTGQSPNEEDEFPGLLQPKLDTEKLQIQAQTKEELDVYIQNLEETLNSVGDDAQLANVDLQNMLQKQQQTLQMMSNIAKMLHDTAMSVIRKIGG
tara:strand:+ start:176 stop:1048 length:873 start_codon:yes stop_codon:yes gene_type:complete